MTAIEESNVPLGSRTAVATTLRLRGGTTGVPRLADDLLHGTKSAESGQEQTCIRPGSLVLFYNPMAGVGRIQKLRSEIGQPDSHVW